jgi:hypothetical protein
LSKRHFNEACFRADKQNNTDAALHVAFCHAYGVGTKANWEECVAWLQKAALGGSVTSSVLLTIMFDTHVSPETTIEKEVSQIDNARLGDLYEKYLGYDGLGHVSDIVQTLDSLTNTCSEECSLDCPCAHKLCVCWRLEIPFSIQSSLISEEEQNSILLSVWDALRDEDFDSLLQPYNQTISRIAILLRSTIVPCSHPSCEGPKLDFKRRIYEILGLGCYAIHGVTSNSITRMVFAQIARNISYMEIKMAARHDNKALGTLIPSLHAIDPEQDVEYLRLLVRIALRVPIAERKLRHGRHYQKRGQKTLELLLQYAFDDRNVLSDQRCSLLSECLFAGNSDLFDTIMEPLSRGAFGSATEPLELASLLTQSIFGHSLLNQSIFGQQREIFLTLLRYGADINWDDGNLRPIDVAAQCYAEDSFFFDELVNRGADLGAVGNGHTVLSSLLQSNCGKAPIKVVIARCPELLDRKVFDSHPILHSAVLSGNPAGISALLESGVDVTLTTNNHSAATLAASIASPESLECLELLLRHETTTMPNDSQKVDRLGIALQCACLVGNSAAVKLLLESKADPNYAVSEAKFATPLLFAWHRRLFYQTNLDTKASIQAPFEERTFENVRRLLLLHGAEEERRFGPRNRTAEEYIQDISMT